MAASSVYIVLFSGDRWWVDFEGKTSGPFASGGGGARRRDGSCDHLR